MRSTFSILPYINRNKVKADGTTAVLCRITIDGKSSTITTGIYCRSEDWNSNKGTIRTVRENNRLQEFKKSVELAYEDSLKKQKRGERRDTEEHVDKESRHPHQAVADGRKGA